MMTRGSNRGHMTIHLSSRAIVVDDVHVDIEGELEDDTAGAAGISGSHACAYIRAFESSNQTDGSNLG